MALFVKTLAAGRTVTVDGLDLGRDTVATLKARLHQLEGVRPELQRLVFAGKQLDDGVALAGCGVHRDSTLHMTLRLRGGPKKAKGKGKGKGTGKKKGSKVRSWAAVDVAAAAYRAV